MPGNGPIGMKGQRPAIEHQLILSAHHIDIQQRQARFTHARAQHMIKTLAGFPLGKGRGIEGDQNLCAGIFQLRRHIGKPDIFTNHDAKVHAFQPHGFRHHGAGKNARIIKFFVRWQMTLAHHLLHAPLGQQPRGIQGRGRECGKTFLPQRRAQQHGGALLGQRRQRHNSLFARI